MNRKFFVFLTAVLSMFLLSGCWDSMELNDRAIELAWGVDKGKKKAIEVSTQVIIPSKVSGGQGTGSTGGSPGNPYFVETGTGKDSLDAVQQMQTKLSRRIFRGQRRIIVIGEPLARKGIKGIMDMYTRDPAINLLTDIFVIKGGTAKEFLKASYPLENIPALGALKAYNQVGGQKTVSFLNFLLAANSEGSCPTMPAIAVRSPTDGGPSKSNGFRIGSIAIFNKDLKLIGFLNPKESETLRWVTGKLDKLTITAFVPQEKHYVSLDTSKLDSHIQPVIQGNKIKIYITLKGRGVIRENNTSLDLTQVKNVALVENALDKQVEKDVLHTVTKVQKEYRTDVFGFGDAIQRNELRQWKSLKKNWTKEFPEAQIFVKANLIVRKIGVTGQSLIQ